MNDYRMLVSSRLGAIEVPNPVLTLRNIAIGAALGALTTFAVGLAVTGAPIGAAVIGGGAALGAVVGLVISIAKFLSGSKQPDQVVPDYLNKEEKDSTYAGIFPESLDALTILNDTIWYEITDNENYDQIMVVYNISFQKGKANVILFKENILQLEIEFSERTVTEVKSHHGPQYTKEAAVKLLSSLSVKKIQPLSEEEE